VTWRGRFAAAIGVVAGIVAGAVAGTLLLPRVDVGPPVAARPGTEIVRDWAAAGAAAGVMLYAPQAAGDPNELEIHGVAGDRYRPVEARYPSGLILAETHRDVLPAQTVGELVTVPGADDAWWQPATDGRRLAARFGNTLVLLSGRGDDELVAAAADLRPVTSAEAAAR
jgi:hypothetical protein